MYRKKRYLEGLGWKDVIATDTERCKTIAEMRAQAMAK